MCGEGGGGGGVHERRVVGVAISCLVFMVFYHCFLFCFYRWISGRYLRHFVANCDNSRSLIKPSGLGS